MIPELALTVLSLFNLDACVWESLDRPNPWYEVRLSDTLRFQYPVETCREMRKLAEQHRKFYEERGERMWGPRAYGAWLIESQWCLTCWDNLCEAEREYDTFTNSRLQALESLRAALGQENYYAGVMPMPTPGWMFRPVK